MAAGEQAVRTVGAGVDAFLARGDLAASSRRSYAQTLNRLAADIGAGRALAMLDADAVHGAMQGAWGACAPATWNRHVATMRSFVAFCRRRGWLAVDVAVGVDRRREPADRTRAIAYAQLERLWRRSDVAVREKALWRREVIRLQGVQRDQRRVLNELLALLDELAANTIDRQLAKSDIQLGLEYVLGLGPSTPPRRPPT